MYLCCVLTYCCLLRPHQEIRLLKWSDFNEDLSRISLSGNKVKSKRNRIVPVPYLGLVKSHNNINIFTGKEKPYNRGYFSTLWKRFKRLNPEIDNDVTKNSASLDGLHSNSKEAEKFRKLTGLKSSELKTMFDSLLDRDNQINEE